MLKNLYNSINKLNVTVGVIGLGYVGLPLSILFSKKNLKSLDLIPIKEKLINLIKENLIFKEFL